MRCRCEESVGCRCSCSCRCRRIAAGDGGGWTWPVTRDTTRPRITFDERPIFYAWPRFTEDHRSGKRECFHRFSIHPFLPFEGHWNNNKKRKTEELITSQAYDRFPSKESNLHLSDLFLEYISSNFFLHRSRGRSTRSNPKRVVSSFPINSRSRDETRPIKSSTFASPWDMRGTKKTPEIALYRRAPSSPNRRKTRFTVDSISTMWVETFATRFNRREGKIDETNILVSLVSFVSPRPRPEEKRATISRGWNAPFCPRCPCSFIHEAQNGRGWSTLVKLSYIRESDIGAAVTFITRVNKKRGKNFDFFFFLGRTDIKSRIRKLHGWTSCLSTSVTLMKKDSSPSRFAMENL